MSDRPERHYLDVPYAENADAKRLGARWDLTARRWYAPTGQIAAACAAWAPLPALPDPLPGEDRGYGQGLYVDLIPDTCWATNARTLVTPREWERLRRYVTGRTGGTCEACGSTPGRTGEGDYLDCHERWRYVEERVPAKRPGRFTWQRTQLLVRLVALCSACHEATHYGRAELTGNARSASRHLRRVRGWTVREAEQHLTAAYTAWSKRSRHAWTLDVGILTAAGIAVAPAPPPNQRAKRAAAATWSLPEPTRAPRASDPPPPVLPGGRRA
jgi:hypothetical protein